MCKDWATLLQQVVARMSCKNRQLHASAPEPSWQTQGSNQTMFPTQLSPWKPFTPLRSWKIPVWLYMLQQCFVYFSHWINSQKLIQPLLRDSETAFIQRLIASVKENQFFWVKIKSLYESQCVCVHLWSTSCTESPLQVMRSRPSHHSCSLPLCDSTLNII